MPRLATTAHTDRTSGFAVEDVTVMHLGRPGTDAGHELRKAVFVQEGT